MKTRICILGFLLFVGSGSLFAQNDSGFEALTKIAGEWEAAKEHVPAQFEAWKWVFKPVMNGKGLIYQAWFKEPGKDWVQGIEVMHVEEPSTGGIYAFGVRFDGKLYEGEGSFAGGVYKLKVYEKTEGRPLALDLVQEISEQKIVLKEKQFQDGKMVNEMEVHFNRVE